MHGHGIMIDLLDYNMGETKYIPAKITIESILFMKYCVALHKKFLMIALKEILELYQIEWMQTRLLYLPLVQHL